MSNRIKIVKIILSLMLAIVIVRLFYWQVIHSKSLSAEALAQRTNEQLTSAPRGKIITADGFVLVSNQPTFQLHAYLPQLKLPPKDVAKEVALAVTDPEITTPKFTDLAALRTDLTNKLNTDKKWVALLKNLTKQEKDAITDLKIEGLGFDETTTRFYPEASMSAHLLGFVGKDNEGESKGYFGLEGKYDFELRGRTGTIRQDTDAMGKPILIGQYDETPARPGRNLKLTIDRYLQHLVEEHLRDGITKYGAASGQVAVMDPKTGAVMAMASLPSFDPNHFADFETSLYKNPVIAESYEPGSTFKVLVMAAGIEEKLITPDSICDETCSGPVKIDKYTIRTWNNQYHPGETMTQVLERSDNTGMIFVEKKLGKDKFLSYLKNFGFGSPTNIDLQEEASPKLKNYWSETDLATASFGQGIAVTGIQMLTAVATIANGGNLVEPHVVAAVENEDKNIAIEPKIVRRVISPATAKTVTDMMVNAALHGEAKWAVLKDYDVAGKTGTAQVPIEGHYDADKTVASFVGFAPAYDPKFVMIVTLTQPQTSQWAAETAAPLWFQLASDILLYLNVPPKGQ